ncbi:MAG: 4a-hydroxytetrahydrobiopterin dehydratase [Planctomycetes bacterium]|nr:4a-hydroxytetrahydrobiopterin dehydratase [Planctomycetota bacterium]
MTRPSPLRAEELQAALTALPDWRLANGALARTFRFADFAAAFAFMARVAVAAEALDHHPDWRNVYATVEVRLVTHDAGAVTRLDVELARRMDALAGS